MPNYGKFIKDILSKKRRLEDTEMVELTEESSAVIQSQLPPKRKDPGRSSIPCTIGTISFQRALCDLGSSINLMPLSVAKRIGLGEIKKTNIFLQMADRSLTYPHSILEDVLVKVDKFIFPADFIVLDMEEDVDTPIILGRPFLITGRMIIDVEKGSLILRDADQEVEFKVFDATKYPIDSEYCFRLEAVDHVVRPQFMADYPKDPLKESLVHAYYCFVDGYSGYNQIPIAPEDQEKTTFTCPFGTFSYRRMPFDLCNAPATFQRCMMSIFSDMVERFIEVFMDDFSVFGSSFDSCLSNLALVLQCCEETNLVLNWEKCHFMVREGIVIGHKISAKGIEVDKAKIDTIANLPPPTSVKGV
ncbi:unnamed protein product [Prunus brigantina]